MTEEINIREFRPGDYDAVISLWTATGLPCKPRGRDSREKMVKETARETADLLVAENGTDIIGTVLATHDGRKGWLNRLAVVPGYRFRGVARTLLETAENTLYKKGIEIIACLIEDDNPNSMKFFKRAGYVKHTDIIYFSKRKHIDV
ncbi:MAG: GNAT family N-acetyltransferase [bacterium]|nr:GNAT family N-acetyltransferase [bacterium]